MTIDKNDLYRWCRIPADRLANDHHLKIPFRLVEDSQAMGLVMAAELVEVIAANNRIGRETRAIVPCGPMCWYKPFREMVNAKDISLRNLHVFHMDECLTWEGKRLPPNHPYNFRAVMERHFYQGIRDELAVPCAQRYWLCPENIQEIAEEIAEEAPDIALGGWGQDGHLAYNQARRHPYAQITLEELRQSSVRIQENNWDTILALAHRTFGAAYQFVPPMSITLGLKEVLSAKKVRVFSDTGSWKQTALRVALFSHPDVEYPITLLQEHPDAIITATRETATHPIGEHPEWDLLCKG